MDKVQKPFNLSSIATLFEAPKAYWVALIISAALLAGAHAFERFGGLAPCALCLKQRETHWAIVGLAIAAILANQFLPKHDAHKSFIALLTLGFLAAAAVAFFHSGVELKFWHGLATCMGGGTLDANINLLEALTTPQHVVGCDQVAWSFLGISMAGWNGLISLTFFGGFLWFGLLGKGQTKKYEA